MEKLGDDEVGLILERVVDRQDRLSCSEVCRQWKRVEGLARSTLRVLETESLRSFLPRFPNLATLELGERTSDLDLCFIADTCSNLKTLNLNARRPRGTGRWGLGDVGDHGLCSLAVRCRLLRKVSTRRRKGIGAAGVAALVRYAQNLKTLDLSWCKRIADEALEAIASAGSLRELILRGCTSITDKGLVFLASGSSSRALKKLDLSLCDLLSDLGVSRLQHMALEELNLSECGPGITDVAGACIAEIRSLRRLDLSWLINLSGATLVALSHKCWNLVELNVTGVEFRFEPGIVSLAGHEMLSSLVMASCCGVTPDDVVQVVRRCQSLRYIALDRAIRDWLSAPEQEEVSSLCRVDWL